ncbi:MAG: hypothetical protein MK102_09190, partial [Fuerstiella sp.]|nr:hypothetical protein [Fuerstiella sp.]
MAVVISIVAVFLFGLRASAQNDSAREFRFDWTQYRTSPVDLVISNADVLQHRKPGLNVDEQRAWRDLVDEIIRRRQVMRNENRDTATSHWEMGFYRYADVRRTAWENGSFQIRTPEQKKDPFRDRNDEEGTRNTTQFTDYSMMVDIQNHPEDFVGKPVVLRGILQRPTEEVMVPLSGQSGSEDLVLSVGDLFSLGGGAASIARVHTTSVEKTCGENAGIRPWPPNKKYLPVLVKGWIIKLWDDRRPLIYCDSVRELDVYPPTALIRQYTFSKQPLADEESWLYYETLSTLETTRQFRSEQGNRFWEAFSLESPQQAAENFLKSRLGDLLVEIREKFESDKSGLGQKLKAGTIDESTYQFELKRLRYLLTERGKHYDEATNNPRKFQTYVDLFMNPDVWQGQLVTLHGHVRHVVSYAAKHPAFHGRRLHELWLFTDDSQNNPAVIVTPTLPDEFPVDAELIDQVSVTGCVFRQYVYRDQESRRIAPLILADGIRWSPTDSHLLALQESGDLPAGSRLARRATAARSQQPGETAVLLVCSLAILTIMILWGRAQRDRRER